MLSRWDVATLVDTRLADMPFVRYEQKLFYYSRLRDAIEANVKVAEGGKGGGGAGWGLDLQYSLRAVIERLCLTRCV